MRTVAAKLFIEQWQYTTIYPRMYNHSPPKCKRKMYINLIIKIGGLITTKQSRVKLVFYKLLAWKGAPLVIVNTVSTTIQCMYVYDMWCAWMSTMWMNEALTIIGGLITTKQSRVKLVFYKLLAWRGAPLVIVNTVSTTIQYLYVYDMCVHGCLLCEWMKHSLSASVHWAITYLDLQNFI